MKNQNHTSHFTHRTSQKGITLIALIITIIVMLILVGVTINVALNGGLFQKAETATRETEEKAILEEMLAMMEIDNNGKFIPDRIIANMRAKHPEYTISYNKPNASITGKLGTYNYIVSETEIKIGSKEIKPFDWEDVGLIVDTDVDYRFYDTRFNREYIINFTTYGELIVKADGTTVETYDAKDNKNINEDGYLTIPFTYAGTAYDTTLTMNTNNVYVDAELKGLTTVTYKKVLPKEYPIAYGEYESYMLIEISETEAIYTIGLESTNPQIKKIPIYPCTDLRDIPEYNNYTIQNDNNIFYTLLAKSENKYFDCVYAPYENSWFLVVAGGTDSQNTTTSIAGIGGMELTLNTTITKEQIDAIIEEANKSTEE